MSTAPGESPSVLLPPVVLYPAHEPTYDDLITEDHKPVDSIFIEKLQRLLTQALYASWAGPGPGRTFLVLTNVGWFYQEKTPAVAPDVLLSLDVTCPPDLHVKQGHSYYQWQMGKPPEVIIEAVSDKRGGEETHKKDLYARLGLPYYAVYDPGHLLSEETLRTYELSGKVYRPVEPGPWPAVGLGLRLWKGTFERHEDVWLRWCDSKGEIIPTGEERARQAEERNRELEAEVRRLKGEPPAESP